MTKTHIQLDLPGWVTEYAQSLPEIFTTNQQQMDIAITLSRLNIQHQTGGPFGAAIFDLDSGKLVSVGLNRVVTQHCSIAHAEMVAIALAQQTLNTFDLSAKGHFQLASSCTPCAMCLGAIPWSGITSLVCGAREEDARAVGFDEGDKPADWAEKLTKRNITVTQDILRDQAKQVLADYKNTNGVIYNPHAP